MPDHLPHQVKDLLLRDNCDHTVLASIERTRDLLTQLQQVLGLFPESAGD